MNHTNYIRFWRNRARLTQQELAEKTAIYQSTVARLESGKQLASIDMMDRIAQALCVTIDQLQHGPDFQDFQPGDHIPGLGTVVGPINTLDRIPLLTSIPAGDWKEWIDQYPPGISEETVARLDVKGEHIVALRVQGDSMIGEGMHNGDLLIVDPEQPFIVPRSGRIGVVKWDGSYKIRRVFLAEDGIHYRLVPANQAYNEERVPIEDTTVFKIVDWRPNKEGMF